MNKHLIKKIIMNNKISALFSFQLKVCAIQAAEISETNLKTVKVEADDVVAVVVLIVVVVGVVVGLCVTVVVVISETASSNHVSTIARQPSFQIMLASATSSW